MTLIGIMLTVLFVLLFFSLIADFIIAVRSTAMREQQLQELERKLRDNDDSR